MKLPWGRRVGRHQMSQQQQQVTLPRLMQAIATTLCELCAREPMTCPLLHLARDQGGDVLCALALPSEQSVPAVRLMVARYDARVAVIAGQVWMVEVSRDDADPQLRAIALGEMLPSELPAHKRQQALVLYGEDREGHELLRVWRITPPRIKGAGHVFVEMRDTSNVDLPMPYRPMFMLRWCEQEGLDVEQARRDLERNAQSTLHAVTVDLGN